MRLIWNLTDKTMNLIVGKFSNMFGGSVDSDGDGVPDVEDDDDDNDGIPDSEGKYMKSTNQYYRPSRWINNPFLMWLTEITVSLWWGLLLLPINMKLSYLQTH